MKWFKRLLLLITFSILILIGVNSGFLLSMQSKLLGTIQTSSKGLDTTEVKKWQLLGLIWIVRKKVRQFNCLVQKI